MSVKCVVVCTASVCISVWWYARPVSVIMYGGMHVQCSFIFIVARLFAVVSGADGFRSPDVDVTARDVPLGHGTGGADA